MRAALGVLADVLCVLAFVIIGRASHQDGESLAGVTSTAWPFLVGLAVGEAATRAWRQPAALVPTGVGVWLATVALGQLLRAVSGPGTDAAFIAVSAVFLGLFLLGWRLVAAGVPALRSRLASRNGGGSW
ncbi:MAG TPA: DUF3054 domain-containing protein [Streptosporangiaceae bacterium]|nr:DUF3054 domain-containing protein [Streptosporangiaceae bacterium]